MSRRGMLAIVLILGCQPLPKPADAGPQPACEANARPAEETCTCKSKSDCKTADPDHTWACSPAKQCLRICISDAECNRPGDPDSVCEDLFCRPRGCGDDAECANGLVCRDGTCGEPIAASAVAACEVAPALGVLNAGGTATFRVLTRDDAGAPLTYAGRVQWDSSGLDAATADTGIDATFRAPASAPQGIGSVTASIGSTRCTPAAVRTYAAATALRVVVVSRFPSPAVDENGPISGATVMLGDGTTATTDVDGIVLLPGAGDGPHTLSVFAPGYDYTTVVGTEATDLLIPLTPSAAELRLPGRFSGTDFARVDDRNGTMHLAFAGGSFAGNLFDLSPDALLGRGTHDVSVSLGTGTSYGPFEMPAGFVLGLGSQMFGEPDSGGGDYTVAALPGNRAIWALGANTMQGDMWKALGPVLFNEGNTSTFPAPLAYWTQLMLGFLQSGDSGLVPLARFEPGKPRALTKGEGHPPMDHVRRIRLDLQAPELPTTLDGLLVLAGAEDPVQGFVPLGAALGMDLSDGVTSLPDHITDADMFNRQAGHLKLRVAARHSGLETSPWAVVTLAMPSMNLFAREQVLTIAGTITHLPDGLRQQDGVVSPLDLSRALPVPPDDATLDEAGRTFSLPPVSGATLHRLDIGPPQRRWSIWFPAGVTSFPIPVPPAGAEDRFPGMVPGSASAGVLHTVRLGYPPPGREAPMTYDEVWRFDGLDANQLSRETDAFSTRWLSRP